MEVGLLDVGYPSFGVARICVDEDVESIEAEFGVGTRLAAVFLLEELFEIIGSIGIHDGHEGSADL